MGMTTHNSSLSPSLDEHDPPVSAAEFDLRARMTKTSGDLTAFCRLTPLQKETVVWTGEWGEDGTDER